MAETKYNLLTRLLKDLRNQVSSSGDIGGKSNGGGVLVVNVNPITRSFDKTWQEIHDADFAVLKMPVIGSSVQSASVSLVDAFDGEYTVEFVGAVSTEDGADNRLYEGATDSPDGYPVLQVSNRPGGGIR